MAEAYPSITVHGFDLDEDAIAEARRNAEGAGLEDRVSFFVADASQVRGSEGYSLVTIFEALHDMSRPVDALRTARELLSEGGSVLVVDDPAEEQFTAPSSDRERYDYGWSVVSCLPAVMGDEQTAATGAVMRPSTLRRYATEAGFRDVEILPITSDEFRFYRLIP